MRLLADSLDLIKDDVDSDEEIGHVVYKYNNELPFTITKEDDIWVYFQFPFESLYNPQLDFYFPQHPYQ